MKPILVQMMMKWSTPGKQGNLHFQIVKNSLIV